MPVAERTEPGKVIWSPPGIRKHITADVVALLERAAAAGFTIKVTGGKVVRNIAGTNRPSLHSFGRAVDISEVNGKAVSPKNTAAIELTRWFRANGASEAFGPGLEPSRGGRAHDNHVHLGIKEDGTPSGGDHDHDAATTALPANATPEQIEEYFRSEYPALAPFMEVDELKDLFIRYAREQRDVGWLQSQLRGTSWWKEHSEQFRERFVEERADPGEAADSLEEKEAAIRAIAEEFLIDLDDRAVTNWAQHLLRDTRSEEDFQTYLRQQAAGLYEPFADQIRAGVDPRTLLSPFKTMASQVWERDVDYSDPIMKNLQTQHFTLGDWRSFLRSRPEWKQTANFREEDAALALFLEEKMGGRL